MNQANIETIRSELLGEEYFKINHPTGLCIMVLPKPRYSSAYAIFGTRYGSIDTRFRREGSAEFTAVPEGIAHFLEHKLFESEERDAFERYAETGASANAYTSFDRTCYLFSCSGNFEASLEILLDFVQSPYFTPQTVEKEQGIIGQEIRMYQDEPGWQVEFNCLRALYHEHPVRIDIAGTVESIAQITDELLYRCYRTFYNLHNMVLAVAGDVTVEQVLAVADRMLKPAQPMEIERNFPKEPHEVVQPYIEQKLAVAAPLFMLGYKEDCEQPQRTLEEIVASNLLLDMIAGETTPLYRDLFEKGLINAGFGTEYFTGYGYAAALFSGESKDPQAVAQAIRMEIGRVRRAGLDPELFERVRRARYGRVIMGYNDVDNLANELVASHFMGRGLFDEAEALRGVTLEDVEKRLAATLQDEQSALSVILPNG